jgi:hypothetical protein
MNASIRSHRSTAYVKPINQRGRAWKPDPITNQFRFIVRMAYACHERDVPYVLTWGLVDSVMSATIQVSGDIPMPKPLPKAPKLKVVADWKPSIWESVYRLDAYHDANLKRRCPGFVIEHSCGLTALESIVPLPLGYALRGPRTQRNYRDLGVERVRICAERRAGGSAAAGYNILASPVPTDPMDDWSSPSVRVGPIE